LVKGTPKFDSSGKVRNWKELLKTMDSSADLVSSEPECTKEWKQHSKYPEGGNIDLFVPIEIQIEKQEPAQYLKAPLICGWVS
jgi:hypothetical protein